MTLRSLLVVLTVTTWAPIGNAQNKIPNDVSRGTINVVLANQNGIVVLTDSMVTSGGHQLPTPAQKLFKLDDRTVCAIAGFLAAPGPSGLYTDSSAMVHEYANQLSSRPPQTIRAHLTSLAFLFRFHLSSIATLRAGTGFSTNLRNYKSELTVAGYDTDGVVRIGQVTLWTVPFGRTLETEIVPEPITEVGKALVAKLAGEPDVAQRLLADPNLENDDAALTAYATSLRQDQGASLTISEMRALASRLAEYTSQKYASVGGENQVAVVQHGLVQDLKLPAFPPAPKALLLFSITADSTFGHPGPVQGPPMSEGPVVYRSGQTLLFLRTKFYHLVRKLDGNYFFDNDFEDCILEYDGGPFYFDKNNRVTKTALFFGPKVKMDDPQVKELRHNFQWYGGGSIPSP